MHMRFQGQTLAVSIFIGLSAHSLANAPDASSRLEEIKVLGEKQDKTLFEVPTSVSVVTGEEIKESTIQTLSDVYNRLPNIASLGGGNESLFSIRGISVQGLTDNPNSFTAGIYVDDIAVDNTAVRYGAMDVWDLAQIEFYRGPQSTLQGRNALNGAIYIKTEDPTYDWSGQGQIYAAEHGTQRYSIAGGGAIVADELAFRISYDDYMSDGYIVNTTRGEDDYAGYDRRNWRGKLLWEPKSLDGFRMLLTLANSDNDIGDNPLVRSDKPYSFEALSDHEAKNDVETDTASLNLSYQLNDILTLTSVTTYMDETYDRVDDWDSTAAALGAIDQTGKSENTTQEFRLNFETGSISGVAGIYYSDLSRDAGWYLGTKYPKADVESSAFQAMMAPPEYGGLGLDLATASYIWSFIPDLLDITQDYDSHYEIENYAIFGEFTWAATDRLNVVLGARYDDEQQLRDQMTITTVDTDTGEPMSNMLLDFLEAGLQGDSENIDTSYEAFLPKFALQYEVSNNLMASFLIQKGYRAGGSSVNLATSDVVPFEPEHTWNYELAMRSMLSDDRIMFNANVFYTDWSDQQIDVSPSGDPRDRYTGNAGKSTLYGAELETRMFFIDELEVFASLGYVKTEFDTFSLLTSDGLVDYSGNEFMGAPNWTGAIGFTYQATNGMFIGVDANYQDESYLNNDNTRETDARTLLNAKLGYSAKHWGFYIWGTNLTDVKYISNEWESQPGISVQDYTVPGQPRTIGASVNFSF